MSLASSLHPVQGTPEEILALLRDWNAASDPAPLLVATSGSTGKAKRVLLSRSAMRASARATHDRLGGPGQWVLNLSPTHVAGLQVLFRSVVARVDPVVVPAGERFEVTGVVSSMAGPRRYLSLVPTQLKRLLDLPGVAAGLAGFDTVLVGGGPLWPHVRRAAESAGVRVVQTYGMSETCGGCVYDGHPMDGVGIKIGEDHQVWLSGPVLFDGYENEIELTALTLQMGWLRTNDLGGFDEDGRLKILGRADLVVISGGVKVPVESVEQLLEAHPRVRAAAVVGVPDEEWGERVVALVEADAEVPLEEIRDLVTPRSWAPREVLTVPRLPRLFNGKLDRTALPRQRAGD